MGAMRICASALLLSMGASVLAQVPDQPFASYWFPNDLLTWSPDSDPDAPFNRSNTPLALRFFNPDLNVNAHARPNEAGVMALSAFGPTSRNPSQGSLSLPACRFTACCSAIASFTETRHPRFVAPLGWQ